ncbi:MAG TPA: sigma-70 family RNA polymerase sigma factor [Schlesneria sp.]|jgi:RNA polymerase sigma-70 factor (ECF subfamily)
MADDLSFTSLMNRIRRGDEEAARELVRRYESELRVIARVRLTDKRVRRLIDSMDICQSIFANFFARVATGQFQLDSPAALLKLLSAMVRNKATDHVRRLLADKRGSDSIRTESIDLSQIAEDTTRSCRAAENQELLLEILKRFTAEEQQIASLRRDGLTWDEISETLNMSAESLRKKFARAVDRVMNELGIGIKGGSIPSGGSDQ